MMPAMPAMIIIMRIPNKDREPNMRESSKTAEIPIELVAVDVAVDVPAGGEEA